MGLTYTMAKDNALMVDYHNRTSHNIDIYVSIVFELGLGVNGISHERVFNSTSLIQIIIEVVNLFPQRKYSTRYENIE